MNRWERRRLRAQAGRPRNANPAPRPTITDQQSRRLGRFLEGLSAARKIVIGVPLALLSLVATLYSLWGPVWPTNPSTNATDVESPDPIAIPIQIKNASVLFPVYDLKITCGVDSLRTDQGGGLSQLGFETNSGDKLEPASSNLFFCQSPFVYKDPKFVSAEIHLMMKYSHHLFGFKWSGSHEEGPFIWQASLKPNRWQKGALVR